MTKLPVYNKVREIFFHHLLYIILLCSVCIVQNSYCNVVNIDSLKAITNNLSESEKSEVNLQIASYYNNSNYDSAIHYAISAWQCAKKSNNTEMLVRSLIQSAISHNNIGNSDISFELLTKAKKLAEKESNFYLVAICYQEKARLYNTKFDYYSVLMELDSAITVVNQHKIVQLKPEILNYAGNFFFTINDIQTSRYYADLALKALSVSYNTTNKVNNLSLQSKIQQSENKYSLAVKTNIKALEISKQSSDKRLIQIAYRRLGAYYLNMKNYDTANMYIDSSISYCNELNLMVDKSSLITYKAHIMWLKNDFKGALSYNLQALKIRQNTGHKSSISSSYLNIGGNYTDLHDYKKAFDNINKGLLIAKRHEILSFISIGYEKLSLLYKLENNYKLALHYNELKTNLNDSIIIKRTNNKVIFFSHLYEIEKKKRLLETIQLKKKSNEVVFLVSGAILALGIIILLFRVNFVRKKSTKEIIKLSKIIETTNQAVAISNEEGKLQYVNSGLVRMLGYSSVEEFVHVGILKFTDEAGKILLSAEILPTLISTGNWEGEINFQKKDNLYITCELTCSVIKDNENNIEMYVALFSDISRRKKYELELKTSRESLKKAVKTQDRIFSIIAHDLTGPFNTILGFSELMVEDYYKFSDDQHIKYNKIINESSRKTYDLLSNLLQWSRSQMSKIEINKEKINLYNLVEENAELLKQQIYNKEINFSNSVDHYYNIVADKATISVVIRNILSNAIKFTSKKGLIYISTFEEPNYSNISISDNGIGIEKHQIDKLLSESETTLSKPGTEEEQGTGLGLLLCKEFIELNKGKIKIDSTIGKGSTFIISLPKDA